MNGANVALVKNDGKRIEVPLEKLSDDDKKFVKQQLKEASENPFAQPVSFAPCWESC